MSAYLRKFGLLAAIGALCIAGPALAEKASNAADIPAKLIVEDNAKMFSSDAIDKAKKLVAEKKGTVEREIHLETYEKLSDSEKKRLDDAGNDSSKKEAFWKEWTKNKAAGEKGVVIAINRSPGHVSVIVSDTMAKYFTQENRSELQKRFLAKLEEAGRARKDGKPDVEQQKIRDEALASGIDYASKNIPVSFGEKTVERPGTKHVEDRRNAGGGGGGGWGIGGWVCLIISILLGVWLITALVRAFTGGGGGGYGGSGGYGGGGGMGGGGFMSSMLGGLFGAAAGMWMYDHFLGGHSSSAYGGDNLAGGSGGGDYGTSSEPIQDSGNFNDDNYSGGDVGGDAGGGGDFGGGGGDFGGGGGDFGGGGGDF